MGRGRGGEGKGKEKRDGEGKGEEGNGREWGIGLCVEEQNTVNVVLSQT